MTLEQLRIFVAVADRQHVTQAARALNLAQSAASHAIAALESQHDTKLFDRVGRRIELTEAGHVFLAEARAVLARAEAAEVALSEFGGLKRGTLSVQASQTIAGYWLPRHLVAFQRAYPRLWIQRPSSERRRDFNPPIHTLPSAHYEPLRHPRAPGLSLTGFRLVSRTPPWGFPYFVRASRSRSMA